MEKKSKIDFFVRLTRHAAKEEIKNKQEALGRELTKEEKSKIVKRHANNAKRKVAATVLAASIGLTGFGTGFIAGRLTAGDEQKESVTTTTKEDFKESLKVEPSTPTPEQEADKAIEQIKSEIAGLDSQEDVLNYWKQLYAENYKEITGETLSTGSLKVSLTNQSYVYQLENGQIVTHGDNPEITEGQIAADGIGYERADGRKVYTVKYGNELIDGMGINGQHVILGNRYNELKDTESVLTQMGGKITNCAFELMDLLEQLENNPGNGYIESLVKKARNDLAEAVAEDQASKTEQAQTQDNGEIEKEPDL